MTAVVEQVDRPDGVEHLLLANVLVRADLNLLLPHLEDPLQDCLPHLQDLQKRRHGLLT
jgi:hypothetical protein